MISPLIFFLPCLRCSQKNVKLCLIKYFVDAMLALDIIINLTVPRQFEQFFFKYFKKNTAKIADLTIIVKFLLQIRKGIIVP